VISLLTPSPPTSSKRSFHRAENGREGRTITIPFTNTNTPTTNLPSKSSNGRSGTLSSGAAIFFSKLGATENDDDDGSIGNDVSTSSGSDQVKEEGFDAAGFAGYLAPYVLTLLLSIAVTGAFFKFVMMDY